MTLPDEFSELSSVTKLGASFKVKCFSSERSLRRSKSKPTLLTARRDQWHGPTANLKSVRKQFS